MGFSLSINLDQANGKSYAPRPSTHRRMPAQGDVITFREDNMAISQRPWSLDRRIVLKSGAVIAAVQVTSPFIIKARW